MNRKSLIALLLAGTILPLFGGCSSGGGTTTTYVSVGPSGASGSGTITAYTTVNGVNQGWQATISGSAVNPSCNLLTDQNCFTSFSQVKMGLDGSGTGSITINSDAIPGYWQFGLLADSTCTTGASSGVIFVANIIPDDDQSIPCEDGDAGDAVVSPASCDSIFNTETGQTKTTCTSTVTLSTSPATMPTTYAVTVGAYDSFGDLEASNSITASSSTSITVPTPSSVGYSVITIIDPTTNSVVAAGLFTRNSEVLSSPCSGTKKSCGG